MMTDNDNDIWSDLAISPGSVLEEELDTRRMTQDELAERMDRPAREIHRIVRGEEPITHRIARELEMILDIPAQFWINMESAYQMTIDRNENQTGMKSETEELSPSPR